MELMNRAGHFRITRRMGRHYHIDLKIVQFINTTLGDLILENRFPCWCCPPNWQMVHSKSKFQHMVHRSYNCVVCAAEADPFLQLKRFDTLGYPEIYGLIDAPLVGVLLEN